MTQTQTLAPNDVTPDDTDLATAKYWQESVKNIFQEIDRFDERIARNQAETDRLRIETRTLLSDLQGIRFAPRQS